MTAPKCQQCGNMMDKKTISSGNFVGIVLALIVLSLGVALLFVPPIGTVAGILLIVLSFGMGGKRRKVWKCRGCGYIFDRA